MKPADTIQQLDALSKTRALTNAESMRLEKLMRAEGLIANPKTADKLCRNGHLVTGANAMPNGVGGVRCKSCHRRFSRETAKRQYVPVSERRHMELAE